MDRNSEIEKLMPKVEQIASSIYRDVQNQGGIDWEELVAVGYLALAEVAERWDPEQGDLERYATRAISGQMRTFCGTQARNIRLPIKPHQDIYKVRAAEDKLAQELQRTPNLQDLIDHLGWSEERVLAARDHNVMFIPLDRDCDEIRPGLPRTQLDELETLAADHGSKVLTERMLQVAAQILSEPEWSVLKHRYGIMGAVKMSTAQIADQLEISEREVSKHVRAATSKLRHPAWAI